MDWSVFEDVFNPGERERAKSILEALTGMRIDSAQDLLRKCERMLMTVTVTQKPHQ